MHKILQSIFGAERVKAWATEFSVEYFLTRSKRKSYAAMLRRRVFA